MLKLKVIVSILSKCTTGRQGYTSKVYSHNTRDKFVPTCHHYRRLGHIRPHCIDFKNPSSTLVKNGKLIKICKEKSRLRCNIVFSVLSASKGDLWYLDSRCSRHMEENKSLFTYIVECNEEKVTFVMVSLKIFLVKIL